MLMRRNVIPLLRNYCCSCNTEIPIESQTCGACPRNGRLQLWAWKQRHEDLRNEEHRQRQAAKEPATQFAFDEEEEEEEEVNADADADEVGEVLQEKLDALVLDNVRNQGQLGTRCFSCDKGHTDAQWRNVLLPWHGLLATMCNACTLRCRNGGRYCLQCGYVQYRNPKGPAQFHVC